MNTPTTDSKQFPSQEIVDRIGAYKNSQADLNKMFKKGATDLKDLYPEAIAQLAIDNNGLYADLEKASPAEIEVCERAKEVEIDGQTPNIVIKYPPKPGEVSEQDQILRGIVEELLGEGDAVTIGQKRFRAYLTEVFTPERREGVVTEWNKFIVGHGTSGSPNVSTPAATHYLNNLGLLRASQGEDSLRERVLDYSGRVYDEMCDVIDPLLSGEDVSEHPNPAMNENRARGIVGINGFMSNFVRGGVWKRNMGIKEDYWARQLAEEVLDRDFA